MKNSSEPSSEFRLKLDLLRGATYKTATFGVFEILTKKLRANNNGNPLSLYQEVCCGLVSGATAAVVWQPIRSASFKIELQNFSYKNMFGNIYHTVRNEGTLALWKGSGRLIGTHMAANMGLLVSYNRSLNYLTEKTTLNKSEARLCASVISGFFYAACRHPCLYVKAIKDVVQESYHHHGDKKAYLKIPFYISEILTPNGGFDFYSGILRCFKQHIVFVVVQWWIFETVRSTDQNKRTGQ